RESVPHRCRPGSGTPTGEQRCSRFRRGTRAAPVIGARTRARYFGRIPDRCDSSMGTLDRKPPGRTDEELAAPLPRFAVSGSGIARARLVDSLPGEPTVAGSRSRVDRWTLSYPATLG